MPDRDGIEGPYSDGTVGCAMCGATRIPAWSKDAKRHRRTCGKQWQQMYPQRRAVNTDEQRVAQLVDREAGLT